jgi:hypothetical protein
MSLWRSWDGARFLPSPVVCRSLGRELHELLLACARVVFLSATCLEWAAFLMPKPHVKHRLVPHGVAMSER